MRVIDMIAEIQALEREIIGRPRVDLVVDQGKRFQQFGHDLRSADFKRIYIVALGHKPWLLAPKAVLKFHYDHRTGIAEAKIPDECVAQLKLQFSSFGNVVEKLTLYRRNGDRPMVEVHKLTHTYAKLTFCCPRCGVETKHICEKR